MILNSDLGGRSAPIRQFSLWLESRRRLIRREERDLPRESVSEARASGGLGW